MSLEREKKDKELKRLLAFQDNCSECPRSKPIQPEPPAPDILFPEHNLGIEITEYSLNQSKNGSLPRQHETVHQRIARAAQAEYEAILKHNLQVSILWTIFTMCPTTREEKGIAHAIAQIVITKSANRLEACHAKWSEINNPLLEKYGVELSIYPIAGTGPSCWSSMACFSFPSEEYRVQVTLDDKEPKVSEYRKTCQTIWLLIVADRTFLSSEFSLEPGLLHIIFKSSFERVFLLDEPRNLVYEFKTQQK